MLNINLDTFKTLFNTHWCDWDGVYGNQCEDLAQFWNFVLGGQPFTGDTADLIYNQPQDIYTQIANTPNNFPVYGDIIVWNWPHVAIVLSADVNQVTVLEQNDPTNGSCQIKTYNYAGVIGWLHPKQLPQDLSQALATASSDRDINWNMLLALYNALGETLDANDKSGSQQRGIDAINALKQQHDKDAQTIIDLKAIEEKMAGEDKNYTQEALDAEHARDAVIKDRKTIYDALNVATTPDALSMITSLKKPADDIQKHVLPVMSQLFDAAKMGRRPSFSQWIQLGINLFILKR